MVPPIYDVGGQDIENAKRTAQTLLYAGSWNPTLNPTEAQRGTLFIRQITGGSTEYYVKMDDGLSVNWSPITIGAVPVGSVVYTRELHVEPYIGNDATADGSWEKPYQTIAAAQAAAVAGGASSAKRYCLILASGEHPGNGNFAPFVSWKGNGRDNTRIQGNWSAVGLPGALDRNDYSHLLFLGTVNLDYSASVNCNIRFIDCTVSDLTWNGGPNYPITQANNLFFHASFVFNLVVVDGAVHCYEGGAILGGLQIQSGPALNSLPFAECIGMNIQGAVQLLGRAQLVLRGCYNTAVVQGIIDGGISPQLFTDEGSLSNQMTGVDNGSLIIHANDQRVRATVAVTGNVGDGTNGSIDFEPVDATAGPITRTLPRPQDFTGREITIKKIDASPNAVTIDSAGAAPIDGAPNQVLAAQWDAITFVADAAGASWLVKSRS